MNKKIVAIVALLAVANGHVKAMDTESLSIMFGRGAFLTPVEKQAQGLENRFNKGERTSMLKGDVDVLLKRAQTIKIHKKKESRRKKLVNKLQNLKSNLAYIPRPTRPAPTPRPTKPAPTPRPAYTPRPTKPAPTPRPTRPAPRIYMDQSEHIAAGKYNFYAVLEISTTATPAQIKKAYFKLVRTHHPDRGGSTEKFQQLQQSYDVLKNKEKKAEYDQRLNKGIYAKQTGRPAPASFTSPA